MTINCPKCAQYAPLVEAVRKVNKEYWALPMTLDDMANDSRLEALESALYDLYSLPLPENEP